MNNEVCVSAKKKRRSRSLLIIFVGFVCLALFLAVGCSKSSEDDSIFKDMSAKQIFDQAETSLTEEDYAKAIRYYEALDSMYPFSEYSQQGLLDSIYAYFENGDT